MEKGLVSVITPCYGTASYLGKLLNSVVSQDYKSIEMIVVDDGSPDDIKSVFESYIPAFKERGFRYEYIRQENAGQSVAISNALKLINGEYLVWPDSDDHYASQIAISKMVQRLQELSDNYGMVRTQENLITDEEHPKNIGIKGLTAKENESKELFEDCIFNQKQFYYCAGAYMIKTKALMYSSSLPIYTSKDAGQNWQLMLPVLYHFRCSTIMAPLYNVVCRETSHSRSKKSMEAIISRLDTYKNTIIGTLDRIVGMPEPERQKYKQELERRYTIQKLELALSNNDRSRANQYYKWLKLNENVPCSCALRYWLFKFGLIRFARSVRNTFRRFGI